MQNQNQVQTSFSWKLASKFIQFAFQDGATRPFGREDEEEENIENASPRKGQKGEDQEQQDIQNSYEPSNQVIDFEKAGEQNQLLQISNSGKQVVDEVNRAYVFVSNAFLPTITVNINLSPKKEGEANGNPEKFKFIELFLAQKSHSSQYQKYKIIKGGIKGAVRQKVKKQNQIKFQKIRFNYYLPSPQKLPRLILVQYEQNQNKRTYKSVMISDQFSVIDNHKILSIQNSQHLKLYFQPISTSFLDKTGLQVAKINSLNKHKIAQQMGTFENYLIKKNKKIWNLVYAAYKYSHIIDLYFFNPDNKPKKQQFLELWKQVVQSFRTQQNGQQIQKTCNHLDPNAKFVLKINSNMRNVRFIINKELTKYLSVIATETEFDTAGKWTKFESLTDLKEAYIVCQAEVQAKIISEPLVSKTSAVSSQQQPQPDGQKKTSTHHVQKNDDEDFNEQDIQDQDDDVQYQGESSQNYSVSNRKRGRKLGQKKVQDGKKGTVTGGNSYRQNKYSTRGGTRVRNKEDTQDSNDKRTNMLKKMKQKQSLNRQNFTPAANIGAPPFRVLTPTQAGQYKDQQTQSMDGKMIGLIQMPMNQGAVMMGMKKPEEIKGQQGISMQKGMAMPVMMPASGMNSQMLAMMNGGAMPAGVQVVTMGNGMQAFVLPADKQQQAQSGMPGMPGMPQGMHGIAMSPMAMGAMGGMPSMGGMGGMSMMPVMMGGGGQGGMPQGFMMPASMLQNQVLQNMGDKSKQSQQDKQKHPQKKQQKKQGSFPPQAMTAVDLNKLGLLGNIGVMPGGQMGGMQMPMMQMGIPGMPGMMASGSGMPQGIIMNQMMPMQKPSSQNKQQSGSKPPQGMQNSLFGGQMPFMMAQMPTQLSCQQSSGQQSGLPMGIMSQFPPMMQMQQQGQGQGQGGMPGGMPMGYSMMMNPQQMRSMNPTQMQQMQQMQMIMMSKGMMPGMMQMPKGDGNDPSKK